MQTHGGQPAADAITARERYFRERVLIDWSNDGQFSHPLSDVTGYVTEVSVESSLSSSLPSELMLIEGASAASMDLTLSGHFRDLPLSAQFAPYNGLSVFYIDGITEGVTVTYDIGVDTAVGVVWYRQFTGIVQRVTTDRGRNEVDVACLDNVERFRGALDLRAAGINLLDVTHGHRSGGLMYSGAIVDLAARANGFTPGTLAGAASPYAATVLSVPFHGTQAPEVGYCDNVQTVPFTEEWRSTYPGHAERWADGGPFGQLYCNALPAAEAGNGATYNQGRWDKAYWVDENTKVGWGAAELEITISTWIYFEGPGQAVDTNVIDVHSEGLGFLLQVVDSSGTVYPAYYPGDQFYQPGTEITGTGLTLSTGWNYVEAQFVNNAPDFETMDYIGIWSRLKAGTSLDSLVDTGWGKITDHDGGTPGDTFSGLVRITPFYGLSDVEVLAAFVEHAHKFLDKDTTVYGNASIADGQNRLSYTFNQVGKEGWGLAKEVAAAEFGVVFFDEHGHFQFWSQEDVLAKQDAIVRDFTLDDVTGLSMHTTTNSIRNQWNLSVTDGTFQWATCYDYASDGPMLTDAEGKQNPSATLPMRPTDMYLLAADATYWYAQGQENLICPDPYDQGDLPENAVWNSDIPLMGKIDYFVDSGAYGQAGAYDDGNHGTKQKWMGHGYWKCGIHNGYPAQRVGFEDGNGQKYFRVRGTMVMQEDPTRWTLTDQGSVSTYGPRAIDLGKSFWRQDYDSVNTLVTGLLDRFSRPVPVTDDITVPGDPRVQLGDTIAVHDPAGMGERIRLQVLGIKRARKTQQGLSDTYSVEVIRPPRIGIWDDPQYGLYDQSFIWGE